MALFNFRSDRMVEISKAFEYEDFNAFDRKRFPKVSPCSKSFQEGSVLCLPLDSIMCRVEQGGNTARKQDCLSGWSVLCVAMPQPSLHIK